MDFFFVEYRDPITGLIVLVALVFIVALSHYVWRIFANKDERQKLEEFVKKFEIASVHEELLRGSNFNLSSLLFLALVFTKSGEFEKAAQIYLIALEKTKDKNEQEEIFLELSKLYFKAGFLEKSKNVLLQALQIRPRNKEALKLLKTIYIKLKLYDDALQALLCLFELGEDTKEEENFIKILLMKEKNADLNFAKIKDKGKMLKRFVYQNFKHYEKQELENIIDLLYFNKDLIEDKNFDEFFYAISLKEAPQNFSFTNSNFKMLYILTRANFKARLDFSYFCSSCKTQLPLFFYHCPFCYEFGTCAILYEVKNDEVKA